MVIDDKKLIEEIQKQFPRVNKPDNYANLILEGVRLGAINKINAIKRKKFGD